MEIVNLLPGSLTCKEGSADIAVLHTGAEHNTSKHPTRETFHCLLPLAGLSNATAAKYKGMQDEWKMNLCRSNLFRLMLLDTLDLPPNFPRVMSEGQDIRRLFNWTVQPNFLFFNWTGSESDWAQAADDPPSKWTTSASGEWAQVRHSSATGPGVDLTYCVTKPLDPSYHIDAQSTADWFEPQAQWQDSDTKFGDSLDDILHQLGVIATQETDMDSRGILQMHTINETTDNLTYASSATDDPNSKKQKVEQFMKELVMDRAQDPGYTLKLPDATTQPYSNKEVLSLWQGVSESWSDTHRLYVAIVQETMKRTRNPALAVQSLFTMATGSVYYADMAQYFDLHAAVSSRSSSGVVFIPRSWAGFVAVAVLVVVHMVTTAVTTVLFLTRTRHSVIGGGGHSV